MFQRKEHRICDFWSHFLEGTLGITTLNFHNDAVVVMPLEALYISEFEGSLTEKKYFCFFLTDTSAVPD